MIRDTAENIVPGTFAPDEKYALQYTETGHKMPRHLFEKIRNFRRFRAISADETGLCLIPAQKHVPCLPGISREQPVKTISRPCSDRGKGNHWRNSQR